MMFVCFIVCMCAVLFVVIRVRVFRIVLLLVCVGVVFYMNVCVCLFFFGGGSFFLRFLRWLCFFSSCLFMCLIVVCWLFSSACVLCLSCSQVVVY